MVWRIGIEERRAGSGILTAQGTGHRAQGSGIRAQGAEHRAEGRSDPK
jgi:hypothetical protein